jgi:predicted lipoprotein with Yx(FWY)xxD motif
VFALAAVASLALAACGDDDDDDAAPAAATDAPAAAATTAPATDAATATTTNDRGLYGTSGDTATTAAAAGGEGAVMVADSSLGQILVDASGMSLYMFMPDAQGDPTCTADCAGAWPPLIVAGEASGGEGVDAALLATATHPESGTQVTYNGWPLYYFAGDSAPGDTNGQGQGDVWYVLDPAGNPISG